MSADNSAAAGGDRVVVVTGAGRGIGAAIAESMARTGARVVVNDINSSAESTASAIREAGGRAVSHVADVTDAKEAAELINATVAQFGQLDVLVNNAGAGHIDTPAAQIPPDLWDSTVRLNLSSQFYCIRPALAHLKQSPRARIINITSRSLLGWPGEVDYSAAKGGVVSLTRALALELGPAGITVNAIAPGSILTPLLAGFDSSALQALIASNPSKRLGTPEDIAAAVEFFTAAVSGCITGQVLYVCGGRSVSSRPVHIH